jgi:phospholipid/cholesterol/gamma-HCH transport system substrate-binding protein
MGANQMKKDTSNKIRLGIFISLGIVVFIFGIYFIGERQQLFRNTFRVSGIFKDVAGLQAGSNVRLSGINVGTVENIIMISDTSVRVEILINESTRKYIKKDAVATIGSEGLMGNKILIINPGTGGKMEIENNDMVETVQPINMDDIFISLKKTIENTSNITGDLSRITDNIQSGKGTIGRLLMDHTLAQNFDSSIVNLKQGSEGLRNLMTDAKTGFAKNFDSTFINMKQGSEGFKNLMDDANVSFAKNFDSTFVNLKKSSAGLRILTVKAKKSWLLWGF